MTLFTFSYAVERFVWNVCCDLLSPFWTHSSPFIATLSRPPHTLAQANFANTDYAEWSAIAKSNEFNKFLKEAEVESDTIREQLVRDLRKNGFDRIGDLSRLTDNNIKSLKKDGGYTDEVLEKLAYYVDVVWEAHEQPEINRLTTSHTRASDLSISEVCESR